MEVFSAWRPQLQMLTQSLINQQGLICCLTMLLYFLIATSFHIYYSIQLET
jgi:hypothetical protein